MHIIVHILMELGGRVEPNTVNSYCQEINEAQDAVNIK